MLSVFVLHMNGEYRPELTAFAGISHAGRTWQIHDENGNPRSRLNAQTCLEALAMVVTVEKNSKRTSRPPSTHVAA
jgi:hypothetical protein